MLRNSAKDAELHRRASPTFGILNLKKHFGPPRTFRCCGENDCYTKGTKKSIIFEHAAGGQSNSGRGVALKYLNDEDKEADASFILEHAAGAVNSTHREIAALAANLGRTSPALETKYTLCAPLLQYSTKERTRAEQIFSIPNYELGDKVCESAEVRKMEILNDSVTKLDGRAAAVGGPSEAMANRCRDAWYEVAEESSDGRTFVFHDRAAPHGIDFSLITFDTQKNQVSRCENIRFRN